MASLSNCPTGWLCYRIVVAEYSHTPHTVQFIKITEHSTVTPIVCTYSGIFTNIDIYICDRTQEKRSLVGFAEFAFLVSLECASNAL